MSRKPFGVAAFIAAVLAAGCVSMTPYEPMRRGEGYSEQKIESNRYRVVFAGNSATPRQTVETYLLYRAAELTLQEGYDYFVTSGRQTEAQTSYNQYFSGFGGFGPYYWGPWYPFFGANYVTEAPSTEYVAVVDIVMFKGKKPANEVHAFDAHEVKANLESQIERPKPKE